MKDVAADASEIGETVAMPQAKTPKTVDTADIADAADAAETASVHGPWLPLPVTDRVRCS